MKRRERKEWYNRFPHIFLCVFLFGKGDLYSNSNLENKNDLHICQFDKSQWREILFEGSPLPMLTAIILLLFMLSRPSPFHPSHFHRKPDEAPRPRPRSAHGAVVFGDHMYIFAGFDGQDRLNDMWRISCTDPTPQWEEVEQLGTHPPTCCNSPLVVAGDYMYAFSGHSGKETTNSLFRFHFPTKVWELVHSRHLVRILRVWFACGRAAAAQRGHVTILMLNRNREPPQWV